MERVSITRQVLCRWAIYLATLPLISVQDAVGQAGSQGTAPGLSRVPANGAASRFFEEPEWEGVCSKALTLPLPPAAEAFAHAAEATAAAAGGQCDEQTLYYGFDKPPDYRAALACAYRHRAHPDAPKSSMLEGAGTLAMLYANGYGVPHDYTLAIRFACEAAERGGQNNEQRIGVLEALRDGKLPAGTTFDLCDEQMSGAMGSYCSELSGRKADVGRARRISAVEARLPQRARAMLPALKADERAFEQARIKGEYPGGGGSGSAGFALEDQNLLREQFAINLERFSAGKVPNSSLADRQKAQAELDAIYKAALPGSREPSTSFGGPTRIGIAATEAAWDRLFSQWLLFAAVAFPEVSPDAVATELLRLRLHQLKKVAY